MNFEQRELQSGLASYNAILSRHLGPDSHQEVDDLLSDANEHVARITWVLDGSYGTEYAILARHWLSDLPKTEKRLNQRLRSVAINLFVLVACLDYLDINPRLITKEIKKRDDMEAINQQIVAIIKEWMENNV